MDRITWDFIILCVLYCLLSPSYAEEASESDTNNQCVYEIGYPAGKEPGETYLTEQHPLLLENDSTKLQLLRPSRSGKIRIANGEEVFFACTGSDNSIVGFPSVQYGGAKCTDGKFKIDGIPDSLPLQDLKCVKENAVELIKDADPEFKCKQLSDATSYSIGAQINGKFLNVINICRNDGKLDVLYTEHTSVAGYHSFKTPVHDGIPFQSDTGLNRVERWCPLKEVYPEGQQFGNPNAHYEAMITRIFGADLLAKYYNQEKHFSPNRVQLAPRRDFPYPYAAQATLFYANTVPQYASINENNWARLERGLTTYVEVYDVDLKIYTGTDGTLSLKNNDNESKALSMCQKPGLWPTRGDKVDILPVPRFLWKIVIDTKGGRGLGFVVSNNPFEIEPLDLCDPLNVEGKNLQWFPPIANQDIASGLVYVCEVTQLVKGLQMEQALTDWESVSEVLDASLIAPNQWSL